MYRCILSKSLLILTSVCMFSDTKHSVRASEGFVPDQQTAMAIRIAEAVLIPIYGADVVAKEESLRRSQRQPLDCPEQKGTA
jgi:hypothetical protein